MRALVTGSNGLLGQKIIKRAKEVYPELEIYACSRGENRFSGIEKERYWAVDISSKDELEKLFKACKPEVVFNCAAITNVDLCETERALCWDVNVDAVAHLIDCCGKWEAKLIHLSTDFVYDGLSGPYDESAAMKPLSYYGESKQAAEELISSSDLNWAIVRTALVYGVGENLGRSNIVLWAKGALASKQNLNVVNDQYRCPTLAEDLAEGCILLAMKENTGVYHIVGKDFMGIDELVKRVGAFYGYETSHMGIVSSASLNQAAKRPPSTALKIDKAINDLGYNPRSFEEGLEIVKMQSK